MTLVARMSRLHRRSMMARALSTLVELGLDLLPLAIHLGRLWAAVATRDE